MAQMSNFLEWSKCKHGASVFWEMATSRADKVILGCGVERAEGDVHHFVGARGCHFLILSRRRRHPAEGPFCRRAPLVLVPHSIMCMGVESFTEEDRSPQHVRAYILLIEDVTVCGKVTPVILHGIVPCVKSLRSSYTGLHSVNSHFGHLTRGYVPRSTL